MIVPRGIFSGGYGLKQMHSQHSSAQGTNAVFVRMLKEAPVSTKTLLQGKHRRPICRLGSPRRAGWARSALEETGPLQSGPSFVGRLLRSASRMTHGMLTPSFIQCGTCLSEYQHFLVDTIIHSCTIQCAVLRFAGVLDIFGFEASTALGECQVSDVIATGSPSPQLF